MSTFAPEAVRAIGAIENLFAAYAEADAMAFALVAELEGLVTTEELARSAALVQRVHPLLNVCIGVDERSHLALLRCDAPVPVSVTRVERIDIEVKVSKALRAPFAPGAGPLMRVDAVTDGVRTSIICVWHHAVTDAKSALAMLRELIGALEGGPPMGSREALPLDHHVGFAMPALRRSNLPSRQLASSRLRCAPLVKSRVGACSSSPDAAASP